MKWVDIWVVNSPFFRWFGRRARLLLFGLSLLLLLWRWWRRRGSIGGETENVICLCQNGNYSTLHMNLISFRWNEWKKRAEKSGIWEWVSESVCIKHIKHILSPGQFYLQHINFAARRQIRYPTVRLGASYLLAQTIGSSRAISCFTNFFQRQRFDMSDSIYVWLLHG